MKNNLHTYRNLGVPCLSLLCAQCEKDTVFSAYFETDAKKQKFCSIGCCECGKGYAVAESVYEDLYELSFEYDRWKEGDIDREEFQKQIPDSCKVFIQSVSPQPKIESLGSREGESLKGQASVTENTDTRKAKREELILSNSFTDLLGTGVTLAILFVVVFFGVSFLMPLPQWAVGGALVATYLLVVVIGLLAGVTMSYKRFPKEVQINPNSIHVSVRGSSGISRYALSDVSRVNFGEGAKYLTLWLSDGKTFVVKATANDVKLLHSYFGKVE